MIRKNTHGEHRTWRRWMGAFLVAAAVCLLVSPKMTQTASAEEEEVQALAETSAEVQTLDEEVTPEVTLSQSSVTFHTTSQSATLTATLSLGDETQEYDSVSWKSSKTSVATVDSNTGVVKPKANGSATITATVSYTDEEDNPVTITGDCTVKVDFYTGVYQDPDGTNKYYYKNGNVDTSITDVNKVGNTWYNLV